MIKAALPANGKVRLALLYELLLPDTPPEECFDMIVEFAASEFNVPICMISLIDADRHWFEARVGIDACETERDVSFCAHSLLADDILLVLELTSHAAVTDA